MLRVVSPRFVRFCSRKVGSGGPHLLLCLYCTVSGTYTGTVEAAVVVVVVEVPKFFVTPMLQASPIKHTYVHVPSSLFSSLKWTLDF